MLFLWLFAAYNVAAFILKDLPPALDYDRLIGRDESNSRAVQLSSLDLQSKETFTWGELDGTSDVVLAKLTIDMPSSHENILSLSRFKGLLKKVDCTPNTIDMAFHDESAFEHARNVWNWVNINDEHTFLLVADTGDCNWNDHRLPFTVSNLTFDKPANSAYLNAKVSTWHEAAHTYSLQVGGIPQPERRVKRQELPPPPDNFNASPLIPFPIAYHLPIATRKIKFPYDGTDMSVAMDCEDCGTTGRFQIAMHIERKNSTPTVFDATFSPVNVSARFVPKLTVAADYSGTMRVMEKVWPAIEYSKFSIPGVMTVHPELLYSVRAEAGPLSGAASLSGGTVASLDDSSLLSYTPFEVGPTSNWIHFQGWSPIVSPRNWVLDGRISGDLKVSGHAKFSLKMAVLGENVDMGINMDARAIAKLENVASFGAPACHNDSELRGYGLNLRPIYGADFNFVAIDEKNGAALSNMTLGNIEQSMAPMCMPYGSQLPTDLPFRTAPAITSTEGSGFSYIAPTPVAPTNEMGTTPRASIIAGPPKFGNPLSSMIGRTASATGKPSAGSRWRFQWDE